MPYTRRHLLHIFWIIPLALIGAFGLMLTASAQDSPPPPTPTPTPLAVPTATATPQPGAPVTPEPDRAEGAAGAAVPRLSITANAADVTEGSTLYFKVVANSAPTSNTQVRVHVWQSGSFLTGSKPTEITLARGQTTAWVILRTHNDAVDEPSGRVAVYLLSGTGYTVGSPSVASTIVRDNDAPLSTPTVTIAKHGSSVTEGQSVYFRITADKAPAASISIKVHVRQSGRFLRGTIPTSVTLSRGSTTAWVILRTHDDAVDELDGYVITSLLAGSGYKVGTPRADTIIIRDNDAKATPTPTPTPTPTSTPTPTPTNTPTPTPTATPTPRPTNTPTPTPTWTPTPTPTTGGPTNTPTPTPTWTPTPTPTTGDPTNTPTPTPSATPTPAPIVPADACVTALDVTGGEAQQSGRWVASCESTNRDRTYAHYYTFSLPQEGFVRIDLTSTIDSYLYLLKGAGKSGEVVTKNDDGGTGRNARVERLLPAGAYTVEATTFGRGRAGAFNLSIQFSPPPEVALVANEPFPAKGDTVTLTAEVTHAPSGHTPTYSWEEQAGGSWKNLTTTLSTHNVTSEAAAVRTFRVTVDYATFKMMTSSTVVVVWDEWEILTGLLDDVVSGVFDPPEVDSAVVDPPLTAADMYGTAESALVECVNKAIGASTYESFVGVMASYTGSMRATVDGCGLGKQLTEMQKAFKMQLALAAGGSTTLPSQLLATERGQLFKDNVADPAFIQFITALIVAQAPTSGASDSSLGGDTVVLTGLDCFKNLGDVTNEQQRYDALNCITVGTPHDFWVQLAQNEGSLRSTYMATFCGATNPEWAEECEEGKERYSWIGYGDLICSPWQLWRTGLTPREFLPACLKHDLTWNGLQGIIGDKDKDLDSAWSPRNKFLSDAQFLIDNLCAMKVGVERKECIAENSEYWTIVGQMQWSITWVLGVYPIPTPFDRAEAAAAAVAANVAWPVTTQDIAHARDNLRYLPCDAPKISGVRVVENGSKRTANTDDATVTLGCVKDIVIERYEWCWKYGKGRLGWESCGETPTRSKKYFLTPKLESVRLFPADRFWWWATPYYEQRF